MYEMGINSLNKLYVVESRFNRTTIDGIQSLFLHGDVIHFILILFVPGGKYVLRYGVESVQRIVSRFNMRVNKYRIR